MKIVLSGEGKTDLGESDHDSGQFKPGPMYWIVDKFIEQKLSTSPYAESRDELVHIHEIRLKKESKKLVSLPKKDKARETGFFYKNARVVAKIAKSNKAELALLFRDSDLSSVVEWKAKYQSALNGFSDGGYEQGVVMLPRPKSEAWLLCALQNVYQSCQKLEDSAGNDRSPNSLKRKLDECGVPYEEVSRRIQAEEIDIYRISMNSFDVFKTRLMDVLAAKGRGSVVE